MGNEVIKDSGSKREFETGAHRDNATGKGRCDLLPLRQVGILMNDDVILNVATFMETKDESYLYEALRAGQKNLPQYKETGIADMILEASKLYEAGAIKYGENNWSATRL